MLLAIPELSITDISIITNKVDANYSAEQVIAAFQKFASTDKNAPPGFIHVDKLEEVLTSYTGKMPKEEARELVEKVESNRQGYINYVEYVSMMMPKRD